MKRNLSCILLILILFSGCSTREKQVTPENALRNYLDASDKNFSWEVKEIFSADNVKIAVLRLNSQEWRGIQWVHQLTIFTPGEINTNGALLFISGGSNKDGEPRWKKNNDSAYKMWAEIASSNNAVVALLSQVPNQPLYNDLSEDALISYTLHNFKSDRDYTWPLLFPMTKSAVKAMDAIQQYAKKEMEHDISMFVVSGASKRGWTTWLTGSQDPRVAAIAPMVIDVLNMPVNIDYQKKVWGDYSIEIEDYVKLGLAQDLSSPDGRDLAAMIDPYSYRKTLIMPKMIFMGTNDPYWPADAVKNYLDEIPGDNLLHYEPNTDHDIGDGPGTFIALSAFFNTVIYRRNMPLCDWSASGDSTASYISVKASADLINATLWICESPDQDFRNDSYLPHEIKYDNPGDIKVMVTHPAKGYRAFFVELSYPSPTAGEYSITTRMFVTDSLKLLLESEN